MKANRFKLGSKFQVFTGLISVRKDPVTDEYPIPAYATDVELIAEKDGFQRYFRDDAWRYVIDNVGTEYWDEDGTKHTIKEIGEEVPEGALLEAPIIPPTLEEQTLLAKSQCTKRINLHWNQIGQINASLGVYGELDTANCSAWISSNRTALIALLTREDLLEIDVTDDQYWPVFEDSSE